MIVLFILLTVIIIGFLIYWKYFHTYSEGYRTGILQKFSYKGNIFKTYEGEMILNNGSDSSNIILNQEKFKFSIININLAHELEIMQGKKLSIHYKQKNGVLLWRGDSAYIADSVKAL